MYYIRTYYLCTVSRILCMYCITHTVYVLHQCNTTYCYVAQHTTANIHTRHHTYDMGNRVFHACSLIPTSTSTSGTHHMKLSVNAMVHSTCLHEATAMVHITRLHEATAMVHSTRLHEATGSDPCLGACLPLTEFCLPSLPAPARHT